MTKSTGKGRGGLRSNPGGRPRKIPLEPIKTVSEIVAEVDDLDLAPLVKKAYRALEFMIDNPSRASTPVVSAAKAIIANATRPATTLGKKEQAAKTAQAKNSGKLATPGAPRLVVDNMRDKAG